MQKTKAGQTIKNKAAFVALKEFTLKNKGFTMIEIIIAIAIISIISSVALPKLSGNIAKAKDGKTISFMGVLRSSMIAFEADNIGYKPNTITQMAIYYDEGYNKNLAIGETLGKITSYQIRTGTVLKNVNTQSMGRGIFLNEKNIAEIYYDNVSGNIWIDGTTGSGVDFVDTKGNLWNKY